MREWVYIRVWQIVVWVAAGWMVGLVMGLGMR